MFRIVFIQEVIIDSNVSQSEVSQFSTPLLCL